MADEAAGKPDEEYGSNHDLQDELKTHQNSIGTNGRNNPRTYGEDRRCLVSCFRQGNKLMMCGNGGSAADSQHMAGEFVNRFRYDRAALPAIALTMDTSILTSIGNDSSFEFIFSRQVEALAKAGRYSGWESAPAEVRPTSSRRWMLPVQAA